MKKFIALLIKEKRSRMNGKMMTDDDGFVQYIHKTWEIFFPYFTS